MSKGVDRQQTIRGARVLDIRARSASFADILIDGDTIVRLREQNAATFEHMQAMAAFVSHHCVGLVREHYHVQRRLDIA